MLCYSIHLEIDEYNRLVCSKSHVHLCYSLICVFSDHLKQDINIRTNFPISLVESSNTNASRGS